jgi:plastocyanin
MKIALILGVIIVVIAGVIGAVFLSNPGTVVSITPAPPPPPGVERGTIHLEANEKNITMSPGETKMIKLNLQSVGGFMGDVSFGLRGPIQGAQIKFNPPSVKITGDGDTTVQVTISLQSSAKAGDRIMVPIATSKTLSSEAPIGLSILGSDRVTVEIRNYLYNPAGITVKKGTTITWVNLDDVAHTVTDDKGEWDSKDMGAQKSWSHTFNSVGVYNYHCTPHPFMLGRVTVVDG